MARAVIKNMFVNTGVKSRRILKYSTLKRQYPFFWLFHIDFSKPQNIFRTLLLSIHISISLSLSLSLSLCLRISRWNTEIWVKYLMSKLLNSAFFVSVLIHTNLTAATRVGMVVWNRSNWRENLSLNHVKVNSLTCYF